MSLCPRVVTMAEDDDDELLQMVRHARVRHVPGARIPRNARARPVRAPRERAVFVVSFEIPVDGRSRPTNIALRLRQALAMSLQQASAQQRGAGPDDGAAAAGGSGEPRPSRAGREPLSPASDASEHKRRRTSEEVTADLETNASTNSTNAERDAAARTDAAADLEEAIRRSLRDANDTAERPAVGSAPRDGQIRGGGEPPPPRTAPAIDAAALAAAFAGAAASTSSAGHAGSRRTNTTDPTSREETREDEKAELNTHRRGSGVPVRRPALAGADEAWWRDDDDDDDERKKKSASGNLVPETSVACPDEHSATALLTDLLGCAVVSADALAKTKTPGTSAGIPIPFASGPGPGPGGSVSVTKKVLDAALASRVSPARLRAAGGGDATATLAAAHARAVAKSRSDDAIGSSSIDSSSWSSRVASMVRASCAEKLVASLEDDGDDLYFEGGRHRSAFFAVLGSMALRRDPATDADAERLLEDMLDLCAFSEKARRAWLDVPRAAFSNAAKVQIDTVDGLDVPLAALAALFRRPRIVRAFRESLRLEVLETEALATEASSDWPSRLLTCVLGCSKVTSAVSGSVMGAFLSRGALPNVLSSPLDGSRRSGPRRPLDANGAAACSVFRTTLRGYPEKTPLGDREKLQDVMRLGAARAYDAAHACALRCVKLKKNKKTSGLETTLAWLAAATTALEADATRGGFTKTHGGDAFLDPRGAPDAFRLGVTALALRFARPIVANAETHLRTKLSLENDGVRALRVNWRHDWRRDPPLGRALETASTTGTATTDATAVTETEETRTETEGFSFVHECFFAAARLFQHSLTTATTRFEEASRYLHDRAAARATSSNDANEKEKRSASAAVARDAEYNAYADCARAFLLEPSFARDACGFALLQAEWLARLAATEDTDPAAARAAFAVVPEGFVKAVARWVCFVLRSGNAELLLMNGGGGNGLASPSASSVKHVRGASPGSTTYPSTEVEPLRPLSVASLVRMACELLSRPALCRHPTTAASLVEMLQCVLIGESGFAGGSGAGLGVRGSATHELLVSSVLSSHEARHCLAPALIRAYTTLDAVENLDVDRDRFDKFHARNVISATLRELWRVDACVASVANLSRDSRESHALFASFASCALGDLMYVLSDALDRLRSVAEICDDKMRTDVSEETARFAKNQERAARGFLRNATETLALLNLFAGSETVAPAFLEPNVIGNAAYAVVRFLETLLSEKSDASFAALGSDEAKIKEKYGFDRDALVLAICAFAAKVDGADETRANGGAFADALAAESDYDAATMERARASLIAKTYGPAALPPLLRDLIDRADAARARIKRADCVAIRGIACDETNGATNLDTNLFDPKALLAALGPDPYGGDETRETEAYKRTFSDPHQTKGEGLRTFGETDDGLGLLVDADSGKKSDFFPPFAALAREADADGGGASSRRRAKTLAREAASLAAGALPLELGSSIFFRHDPDRLDVARVVIVGPANTPYEGGAFAFDVFCPNGYPDHPPMVNLDTTGGGRARFNPNLYADGKVCLSLLGTWHGGAAEEKWDASRSTLAQVFVSVQGLIFVDDPMFNEPGFDGLRGTREGEEKSAAYNAEIRLFTVRHAMIDALRKPRRGIAATVKAHFKARRWSVMRRVLAWCEDARDPVIRKRTREAAVELSRQLARLAEEDDARE